MLKNALIAALATLALAPAVSAQRSRLPQSIAADERIANLSLGYGSNQRVLYDAPTRTRATLIMLPGGTGDVDVRRDGDLRHNDNFVVRTRTAWVSRGYAVLIPNAIDETDLRGVRSSAAYARVVDALTAYARAQAHAPVFLLGTSQGTIAAVNGAAHAPPGGIAGLILTEAVSVPGRLSTETSSTPTRRMCAYRRSSWPTATTPAP